MRRSSIAFLVLAAAFGMGGCGAVGPLPGFIYTDVSWPGVASQAGPTSKTGTAQAHSWFGVWATGDASVAAACKNGGITKINTVDEHGNTTLGIYTTYTTIVTGQ